MDPQVLLSHFAQFFPLMAVMGVVYFLLIRPQQKKASLHQVFLQNLKAGDAVMTSGGIFGTVEEVRHEDVLLTIAPGVTLRIQRNNIVGENAPVAESAPKTGRPGINSVKGKK